MSSSASDPNVVTAEPCPYQEAARPWVYPVTEPFNTGRLKVSDIHEIFFEEVGNPKGIPAVFVHGGPGGGVSPADRTFFDPEAYRVVLFDQRGAGKSTPHACLEENTTWLLVEDMEKLRTHLGIDKWLVFGGSWGSTLALAYAETHPDRVTAMVLRGIFTLRRRELEFFYQEGSSWFFTDAWEQYYNYIPEVERGDMMSAYHRRLTSSDKKVQLEAAKRWSIWEGATSKLLPDSDFLSHYEEDDFAIAFARIECHYFVNGGFFERENQLIDDSVKLSNIPAVIVQGRYDLVCPFKSAWDLHKKWPSSKLVIVPDAGHNSKEFGTQRELIKALDDFKVKLGHAA